MNPTDMNEALQAGLSLVEMEAGAVPMKTNKDTLRRSWANEGYGDLLSVVDKIQNADAADQKELGKTEIWNLQNNESRIENIAWKYHFEPEKVNEQIKLLNKIYGLKTPIRFFQKKIESILRKHKKTLKKERVKKVQSNIPMKHRPDPVVLNMCTRKAYKDKETGEIVEGDPYANAYNCEMVWRHDPRQIGRVKFCELDCETHYNDKPISDNELGRMMSWMFRIYKFEIPLVRFKQVLAMIGEENSYHPVKDYLDGLTWNPKKNEHKLKYFYKKYVPCEGWDEEEAIIDDDNADYSDFGITDENPNIYMIYGIRMFLAMVNRAYNPGIKSDSVTAWIGGQAANKSQTVEALSPKEAWWSDADFDITKKDAYMIVIGKWIVELPECEVLNRVSYSASKAFLSKRKARFRGPWKMHVEEFDFSHYFIATTNEDRLKFLNDPTGSRRFWTVKLLGSANLHELENDLDDLWAEAAYLYNQAKHNHWLTDAEKAVSTNINALYRSVDTWEEKVAQWLKNDYARACITGFSLKEVVDDGLKIPTRFQRIQDQTRAAEILKMLGCYKNKRRMIGKTRHHIWYITEEDYENIDLQPEIQIDQENGAYPQQNGYNRRE